MRDWKVVAVDEGERAPEVAEDDEVAGRRGDGSVPPPIDPLDDIVLFGTNVVKPRPTPPPTPPAPPELPVPPEL
jgi:hypothetical protein